MIYLYERNFDELEHKSSLVADRSQAGCQVCDQGLVEGFLNFLLDILDHGGVVALQLSERLEVLLDGLKLFIDFAAEIGNA